MTKLWELASYEESANLLQVGSGCRALGMAWHAWPRLGANAMAPRGERAGDEVLRGGHRGIRLYAVFG